MLIVIAISLAISSTISSKALIWTLAMIVCVQYGYTELLKRQIRQAQLRLDILLERITNIERTLELSNEVSPPNATLEETSTPELSDESVGESIELQDSAHRDVSHEEPSEAHTSLWAQALWDDLLHGSLVTRVGALMLLIGLSYLIRYVAKIYQPSLMSVHVSIASLGVILLGVGWRLAHTRQNWRAAALATQGAGLTLNALSLVSAARVYHIITLEAGFGGLCLTMVLGVALALRQRSIGLAFTCIVGAFITPALLPVIRQTEPLSYSLLLCYETVINLAILRLSTRSSWRSLNLIGFTGTSVSLLLWAHTWHATPVVPAWHLQLALAATILIFSFASLSQTTRQRSALRGWLDGYIWWGAPGVVFGVERMAFPQAPSLQGVALALLGGWYITLFFMVSRGSKQAQTSLAPALLLRLSAVAFGLAIALLGNLEMKLIVWCVEGVGLAWLSHRQGERVSLWVGLSFVWLAALMWSSRALTEDLTRAQSASGLVLAGLTLTLAYLLSHDRDVDRDEASPFSGRELSISITSGGDQMTLLGLMMQISALSVTLEVMGALPESGWILSLAVSPLLFFCVGKRLTWPQLSTYSFWITPLTMVTVLGGWYRQHGVEESVFLAAPIQTLSGALIVVIALMSLIYLSWRAPPEPQTQGIRRGVPFSSLARYSTLFAALGWAALESYHLGETLFDIHTGRALTALVLSLPLWALVSARPSPISPQDTLRVPLITRLIFPQWHRDQSRRSLLKLLVVLTLIAQVSLWSTPPTTHLGGLPLLNPVDLSQGVGLYILLEWYRETLRLEVTSGPRVSLDRPPRQHLITWLIGVLIFVTINIMLLRGAVVCEFTPFSHDGFWSHHGLQAIIAIFWCVCALTLMRSGSTRRSMYLWWIGLGLLVVTLLKVWVVDLQITNQLGRVIAFMGVGCVMLLVGYWAPAPQHESHDQGDRGEDERRRVDLDESALGSSHVSTREVSEITKDTEASDSETGDVANLPHWRIA